MKTLSLLALTAALSAGGLTACGDDTGGGTTGSGGSGGSSGDGGSTGDGGSPSGNPTSTTTGNTTSGSSSDGGGDAVTTTNGSGGGGVGGGIDCGDDPFLCGDGACIPAEWECDALPDCEDGSDELPVNAGCPVFTCADGTEIPDVDECDDELDCPDESDEYPVNANCEPPPEVPPEWICDPGYYGVDDGCDCGCGAVDADCADATEESCEYCFEPSCADDGSGEGTCDLDALVDDNNAVCL